MKRQRQTKSLILKRCIIACGLLGLFSPAIASTTSVLAATTDRDAPTDVKSYTNEAKKQEMLAHIKQAQDAAKPEVKANGFSIVQDGDRDLGSGYNSDKARLMRQSGDDYDNQHAEKMIDIVNGYNQRWDKYINAKNNINDQNKKMQEQYKRDLAEYQKKLDEYNKHRHDDGYLSRDILQHMDFSFAGNEHAVPTVISGNYRYLNTGKLYDTLRKHISSVELQNDYGLIKEGIQRVTDKYVRLKDVYTDNANDATMQRIFDRNHDFDADLHQLGHFDFDKSRYMEVGDKPVTVRYTNMNANYAGRKINKMDITYRVNTAKRPYSHPNSDIANRAILLVFNNPAYGFLTYGFKNQSAYDVNHSNFSTAVEVKYVFYDTNGHPIEFHEDGDHTALLSFDSLNVDAQSDGSRVLHRESILTDTHDIKLVPFNGSSITVHPYGDLTSGFAKHQDARRWDNDDPKVAWYGAIAGVLKTGRTPTFTFMTEDNKLNEPASAWFYANSKVMGLIPPTPPVKPKFKPLPEVPKFNKLTYHLNHFRLTDVIIAAPRTGSDHSQLVSVAAIAGMSVIIIACGGYYYYKKRRA